MAYEANIPLATDKKSISQGDMLGNFTAINTFIEINHEPFASGARGKHIKVDLTKLAADPSTAANEIAVYNVDNELRLREHTDGADWNLTPSAAGHIATGYEVLPSGLIMNWGQIFIPAGTQSGIATFGMAFPTAGLNITHSVQYQTGAYDARDAGFPTITLAVNQCTFTRDGTYKNAAVTVRYFAIGH